MALFHYFVFACFFLTRTEAVPRCPEGWQSWVNPASKSVRFSCFQFYVFGDRTPALSYGQARAYCQDVGGNLATFMNEQEIDDFVVWTADTYNGPNIKGLNSFMLGYAYLRDTNVPVYEGLSDTASFLFPGNDTAYWSDPDSEVTQGAVQNVVVLKTENKIGGGTSAFITEEKLENVNDIAHINGFVCKKPIDKAVCSKLNQPYISTFGGRRVPLRPYSRYWLMYSTDPWIGTITILTTTTPPEIDPQDPVLSGPPMKPVKDFPRHGPQITYVEFSTYSREINVTVVTNYTSRIITTHTTTITQSRTFGVYRVYDAGQDKYNWFARNIPSSNNYTLIPMTKSPIILTSPDVQQQSLSNKSLSNINNGNSTSTKGNITITTTITSPDSVVATWYENGGFNGGWLIAAPAYEFFYDGVDIQVFMDKTTLAKKADTRGLCDVPSNGPKQNLYNKDLTTKNKTANIFTFARGQLRSPQFSPVSAGRPTSCTSPALHEAGIRACFLLINPISPIGLLTPPGCFQNATDLDNPNNTAFADPIDNLYQACVESVCAHGFSARCYYSDKLLARMQRLKCLDNSTRTSVLQALKCDTTGGICGSMNGQIYNGNCYFLKSDLGGVSMFDGEVTCTRSAAQLAAPRTPLEEAYILANITGPESVPATWIGVMTSLMDSLEHSVAFKKTSSLDEAALTATRSLKLEDFGYDQCIKMDDAGLMDYTSCTDDTDPYAVCASPMTDPNCPAGCLFPKQCNAASKTCVDPCPTGYETGGRCSIATM